MNNSMAVEPYSNTPGEILTMEGYLEFADDETRRAILALPPIQRDALLRTAHGESDEEIAAANGVDCRQARKRRHYARKNIAEALAQNCHTKL
jgi:DNA-directed RNA polymerase specialized sigma24 family protein